MDTLRRVKAIDPNISTVFYYNSVLDWPFYKLHAEFLQHPSCSLPLTPRPPIQHPDCSLPQSPLPPHSRCHPLGLIGARTQGG